MSPLFYKPSFRSSSRREAKKDGGKDSRLQEAKAALRSAPWWRDGRVQGCVHGRARNTDGSGGPQTGAVTVLCAATEDFCVRSYRLRAPSPPPRSRLCCIYFHLVKSGFHCGR